MEELEKYLDDYIDYIGDRNSYDSLGEENKEYYRKAMMDTLGYAKYRICREMQNFRKELKDGVRMFKNLFKRTAKEEKKYVIKAVSECESRLKETADLLHQAIRMNSETIKIMDEIVTRVENQRREMEKGEKTEYPDITPDNIDEVAKEVFTKEDLPKMIIHRK